MHNRPFPPRALAALVFSALLAACGGDGATQVATASGDEIHAQALQGGNCSGPCAAGSATAAPGSNPLPTMAPAPDIVVRDSFGPGPEGLRPRGGSGDLQSTYIGATLGGFWAEWPGKPNSAWITPGGKATWKLAAGSSGGPNPNPHEQPSPLEVETVHGQVFADLGDGAPGPYPTALLPVAWPTTAWSMSIEGMLGGDTPASYIALGLTDSGATRGNLMTASTVTLLMRRAGDGPSLVWELWRGGATRTLLATGPMADLHMNQLKLSYDPQAQQLAVHVNGAHGGSFRLKLDGPRYAAFEGHGMVDNFVVRKVGSNAQ